MTRLPTYEYHCDTCEKNFDVVQSFHDEPLTTCPTCGSPIKKVFGSVGIVFKGSGFYKTDSRPGKTSAPAAESTSEGASGTEGSGSETTAPAPTSDGASKTTTSDSGSPSPTSPTPAPAASTSSKDSG